MVKKFSSRLGFVSAMALVAAYIGIPADGLAQEPAADSIQAQIEFLEQQIEALKQRVAENERAAAEASAKAAEAAGQAASAERQAEAAISDVGAADRATTRWHLAGYADAGFTARDGGGQDNFVAGHFNPSFHFQYKDFLFFEAELELGTEGNGETEIELEYSSIDLILNDNATLIMGKFLSPVGQFQERLHPTWINKLANAPAGFGHGGVQPTSEVGIQARGGVPIGNMVATYAVAIGNGPRMGEHGIEVEGFGNDDNKNKAVSGRFAILPLPWLEFGGSFLTGKVDERPVVAGAAEEVGAHGLVNSVVRPLNEIGEPPQVGDYNLWGFDTAVTKGGLDIRFEYLQSKLSGLNDEDEHHEAPAASVIRPLSGAADPSGEGHGLSPDGKTRAWYAQIAYRLSDITENRILGNFEPVFRYGEFKFKGVDELGFEGEKRFDFGLNYWLGPTAVARGVIEKRNFDDVLTEDETSFQFQFAYGF